MITCIFHGSRNSKLEAFHIRQSQLQENTMVL